MKIRTLLLVLLVALAPLSASAATAPSEEELRSLWVLMDQTWIFQG